MADMEENYTEEENPTEEENYTEGGYSAEDDEDYTDKSVTNLIINRISKAVYDNLKSEGKISDSELYTLTDLVDILDNISAKIKDIELFKFPNATIVGTPLIEKGQVSRFTTSDFLQFPFIVDVKGKSFQIDFVFTTSEDINTQQNIIDSEFGLALAIKEGKTLTAISSNGTSWNVGNTSGTINILPNTTYYVRFSWDKSRYSLSLSTDGETFTEDVYITSTLAPYPRTIFIGGATQTAIGHTPTPFKGIINLNKAYLTIAGLVIWQGMDDAGLATRADVSLSNLNDNGVQKIKSYGLDISYSAEDETLIINKP